MYDPLADIEGGTGDEALDVGREFAGEIVVTVVVKSGWDTELTQHKLDSRDNFLIGRLPSRPSETCL